MGHTIWIEVQGRPQAETANDMSVLHRLDKQLDALCEKLGVAKLSGFYDYSELIGAYGDSANDDATGPTWFDSNEGLRSVKELRDCLTRDFSALGFAPDAPRKHWPEALLNDLQYCESVLADAVARAKPFHLLIVP